MQEYVQKVRLAQRGDTDAFAELYGEVYQDMYRFARYTLRNANDAEDAVSDAVADAFASIRRLRLAESFRPWIFRILSNKCKDKIRDYLHGQEELPEDLQSPENEQGMLDSIQIRRLFYALSDEERFIISMHIFAGYTSREIAEILHMNENTVRSKESRGLKKMAAGMEKEDFL